MNGEKTYSGLRFWALFLAGLAFAALAIMLVIVTLHAAWPGQVWVGVLNPLFYIFSGSAISSVISGLVWFLVRYPTHRTVLLLLTLITAGILVAHFAIINDPPAYTNYTLSGNIGSTVYDDRLTLTSTLTGTNLAVVVQDTGGDAVSSVSLSVGGLPLSESGLVVVPSLASPLLPGNQVSGSWNLQSTPSGPVTLSYVDLSCYDVQKQVQGCVMDEIYYVPAALTLLAGEKCGPYIDNCNLEHPFLSKAIISAGIAIFGDNAFGWRFFEVVLGTASIPVLFAICWSVTRDPKLSIFAAYLLAFETLFFVHSSIAVIDVQMIFFALLAFMVYLANVRIWILDRVTLSAILLGLSALSKETAIFLVAFLAVYNLFLGTGDKIARARSTLKMLLIIGIIFAAGLQLYVTLFGNSSTTTFVDDINYILSYGASLKMTPTSQGWIDSAFGTPITPLNWMTYYSAIGYLVTRVTISGPNGYTYVALGYWGITNFFEVWLTYLWAPVVAFLSYRLWISRAPVAEGGTADEATALSIDTPSFRLARFALLWFIFGFFPYVALYLYGRITYPYYILSAMPAISIGCAYLFTRKWFPSEVAYVLLGGVFLWFFLYFPDKFFLPTWLRMVLGH